MKHVAFGFTLWLAVSSMTIAQTGGYPASPSHAVTGAAPDGTPRYGSEPRKATNDASATVGNSSSDKTEEGRDRLRTGEGGEEKPKGESAPQR